MSSHTFMIPSSPPRDPGRTAGNWDGMSLCKCVNLRVSIFISLTGGSEEKGGDLCGDYSGTLSKYVEYLCVLHERMYVQRVCVCDNCRMCSYHSW